jgi:hypothetical protein
MRRLANATRRFMLFVCVLTLVSCRPASPSAVPDLIRVRYSFTTQPWISELENCAGKSIIAPEMGPTDAQALQTSALVMRFGEPDGLTFPAYQIGMDDLLVIVNRQNPISKLTIAQVIAIFSGQTLTWQPINNSDNPIHVWVFSEDEDIQQIFARAILKGLPTSSDAHLAASPDQMTQAVAKDADAIGIISRRWSAGNTVEAYRVASGVPVLAISQAQPSETLAQILACMQR